MDKITNELLHVVSGFDGAFQGAFNIRENGQCAGRRSTENIRIESKEDAPGLIIYVNPGTKGETVSIPACVTQGGIDDLVYNDFYIGEGADIVVVAGCGIHTGDGHDARHKGIHRFFLEKASRVLYEEKHIGLGEGSGRRHIDPVTEITLAEDAVLEMNTIQISGVDDSLRKTNAVLGKNARLMVRERIMTSGSETARTEFEVTLEGEDSKTDLVSRSVARGNSRQEFCSGIRGLNRCGGHSECDAILADNGVVIATPSLFASHVDAALIHEAAIGKIAGEQILKLRTLGLTEEQAEEKIISGFLK